MNREEAIDLLDNLIGFIEDNHGSDYDEALKIAIKALKQESCEDAIHRDRTVQDFADKCRECGKQKKGKWIPIPFVLDYESDAKCSLCQESFINAIDYNYCPNCGAKMAESEEV